MFSSVKKIDRFADDLQDAGVPLEDAGKPQTKLQPPKKKAGRRRKNPDPPASAMLVQSSATCATVGSRRTRV